MIVYIISIMVAIICYVIGKRRSVLKNNFEIIRHILWVEACVFMAGYFFTDKNIYKLLWSILLGISAVFSFIYSIYLKKEK